MLLSARVEWTSHWLTVHREVIWRATAPLKPDCHVPIASASASVQFAVSVLHMTICAGAAGYASARYLGIRRNWLTGLSDISLPQYIYALSRRSTHSRITSQREAAFSLNHAGSVTCRGIACLHNSPRE